MDHPNPLNVYKGPESLLKYFDPDFQPLLPLVELPAKINPFRQDGVRIYAKMLTALPAQNVKNLPALNMLLNDRSVANKSIVEASSGSTVTSLGMIARVLYDNYDTTAFCTNKTERNRLRQLQFFGLKVELYGGPAQPEFTDQRGIIERARRLARENDNIANPAQYDNENNWKSHVRWTGPQLWKQLPEINIFCMGMGSSGCITGAGSYLKSHKSSVKVLGVCNAEADPVPGPRAFPLFESCSFPWKEVVDDVESVNSVDSYRLSLKLSREGLIAGPSSGMALQGLFNFLQQKKDEGTLSNYADSETGDISCVFVCCDLPQQYLDTYFYKLGEEAFHPIKNDDLLSIDQDVYDLKWEIDPVTTNRPLPNIIHAVRNCVLNTESRGVDKPNRNSDHIAFIDLRSSSDFVAHHINGSINSHLPNLAADTLSPFDFEDTSQLHVQWRALNAKLNDVDAAQQLADLKRPIVVLCYNGDTSRIAVAIMRAQGLEAYSFIDGMPGLVSYLGSQRRQEDLRDAHENVSTLLRVPTQS